MIDWNFIALCVMLVLLAGMVIGYFSYEMYLCHKISEKLSCIEKLVDEQGDSNDMDK